eukprot:c13244_g1_i2 orf=504-1793(+)
MFVGHLGELELASASIAVSFANVTGLSLVSGMACALETLCGQAYGAEQYRMMGICLERAVLILNLVGIPLSCIWLTMEKILLFLGQDPDISRKAGEYACWLIPNIFAYAFLQPLIKFLQVQSLVIPMVVCSSISLACHVPICWFLVYKSGLGNRGAALASCISNWINVVILILYVGYSQACEKTRTGLSWEVFKGWKVFLKLAIPAAAMVCLEWWSYELVVLLSGLLPNPQLSTSALSICLNTASLIFMVPFGLSAAASTRVSNELGAGRTQPAQHAVHVSVILALLESTIISIGLLSTQHIWGWAYSNEREVVSYVASLIPFLAISNIADGFAAVLSGVARGCGWQNIGAYVNLGSYYVVGIPAALVFCFVLHMEGKGLWMGVMVGSYIQFITLISITLRTNWDQQAKDAISRVQSFDTSKITSEILI